MFKYKRKALRRSRGSGRSCFLYTSQHFKLNRKKIWDKTLPDPFREKGVFFRDLDIAQQILEKTFWTDHSPAPPSGWLGKVVFEYMDISNQSKRKNIGEQSLLKKMVSL